MEYSKGKVIVNHYFRLEATVCTPDCTPPVVDFTSVEFLRLRPI
jgi:hypothetical protein